MSHRACAELPACCWSLRDTGPSITGCFHCDRDSAASILGHVDEESEDTVRGLHLLPIPSP